MATIVLPYTVTDGNVLDPAQFNRDIYGGGAEGVTSEPNGRLVGANLDASYRLKRHMLSKNEHFRLLQEVGSEPLDYMTDAIGNDDEVRFVDVAGTGIRFHLPYKANVLLAVQAHVSLYKMWVGDALDEGFVNTAPSALVRLYLDGNLTHATWELPQTVYPWDQLGTNTNAWISSIEDNLSQELSMCDLQTLSAGYHEATLRLYLEMNGSNEHIEWDTIGGNPSGGHADFHTRVTFSLRGATVLALFSR